MNKIGITLTAHYTKLEEPILRIINLVMVERIYSVPHQEGDSIVNELVILISNKATQALAELSPIINTILFSYPTYHYRLFYAH